MALPYDATMKDLLHYAADWLRQLHIDVRGPVAEIDADLSTVTALADKVLRIGEDPPWLLHLELQASRDSTLPRRLLKSNSLLHEHHALPVHSVVVLLRRDFRPHPERNSPNAQTLCAEVPRGLPVSVDQTDA